MVRAITSTVGWRRGCRTWSYRYPSTRRSPLCQPLPSWGSWPLTPGAVSCTSTSQFSLPQWAHIQYFTYTYTCVCTCTWLPTDLHVHCVYTACLYFCRKECAVNMCCACVMCLCVCWNDHTNIHKFDVCHLSMFVTCKDIMNAYVHVCAHVQCVCTLSFAEFTQLVKLKFKF